MRRWFKCVPWFGLMILAAVPAWGGNRELVEQRTRELDAMNRSVVQQIPELPRNGRVHLKARVKPDGAVELIETEITRSQVKSQSTPALAIEDENVVGLRSALQSRTRGESQIRPYRDDNSDGRYPRLRDALVASFGKGRL